MPASRRSSRYGEGAAPIGSEAWAVGATPNSTNHHYAATNAQGAGVAFYTNTGQFATGGGWIADSASSTGQGSPTFNARYTKTGGAKGQMACVWQGMHSGCNDTTSSPNEGDEGRGMHAPRSLP
jgi:hypothetical protein